MDLEGQALFELLSWVIVAALGLVSFVVGYVQQDFALMAKLYGGGAIQALNVRTWCHSSKMSCLLQYLFAGILCCLQLRRESSTAHTGVVLWAFQ
jgi:hypothetical protein